ncbi:MULTISPECIES: hypothetical protein [unclassified Campylobacter]|uniref:hypothetical protein n=1 Tax=unclassified Campylobacter TaxID=2593542 RepID=UPI0022E9E51B|nr:MULTISPECIES: hypothetical protein [unclassified Campylobacter]MDA3048907.1 hypothetical protein [Campylobacter sp. JMF_15 NE4]MDA3050383.1 hypothetical protein [Campylobacter sp. JMF_02 ED1]MDA3054318.1 hypothetical protein [Campylobacter sp. VBCF_07 NA4]MDA3061010.1 hypothetical protein [Campylobacter sp. VBCF_02 NA5]MDA3070524.1 hypothetical protein [Campylobacter sp. VBCF_08 NA3]
MMNNKDFCKLLKISEPTLYNWKKEKEFLYKIVMEYKENSINKTDNVETEFLKYFNNLSQTEKEYYIADIKARILKKEIDKESK